MAFSQVCSINTRQRADPDPSIFLRDRETLGAGIFGGRQQPERGKRGSLCQLDCPAEERGARRRRRGWFICGGVAACRSGCDEGGARANVGAARMTHWRKGLRVVFVQRKRYGLIDDNE